MSQVLELQPAAAEPATPVEETSSLASATEREFEYRPVPVLAVVGAVLGVLSVMALLGITGIVIAFVGTVISGIAVVRILAARGGLGGKKIALLGLVLSVVFFGSGTAYQRYLFMHEVPEGYERTSFSEDISRKGLVAIDGMQTVHPDVVALAGKPVFLKGFMYPTNETTGIASFLLVKDSGTCCFGGQPALQDMIGVVMQDGLTVNYQQGRVAVAGVFELNPNFTGQDSLEPLFLMKGKYASQAQTAF